MIDNHVKKRMNSYYDPARGLTSGLTSSSQILCRFLLKCKLK